MLRLMKIRKFKLRHFQTLKLHSRRYLKNFTVTFVEDIMNIMDSLHRNLSDPMIYILEEKSSSPKNVILNLNLILMRLVDSTRLILKILGLQEKINSYAEFLNKEKRDYFFVNGSYVQDNSFCCGQCYFIQIIQV
jgi:hypothetical protein